MQESKVTVGILTHNDLNHSATDAPFYKVTEETNIVPINTVHLNEADQYKYILELRILR
jgi:hypothetical protein